MIYDLIGDIHGHARELKKLLEKLGYSETGGVFHPQTPNRIAIFVGDLIDRGSENFEVLRIVRSMKEAKTALCVMGNHEYNACCYHLKSPDDAFLRPHNNKNRKQHENTLKEIEGREEIWQEWLDWFRTLPMWIDTGELRIIHACWDKKSMAILENHNIRDENGRLTDDFFVNSCRKHTEIYDAVEVLLKGPEIKLPGGLYFVDKDGNERREARLKWWREISLDEKPQYEDIIMAEGSSFGNNPVDEETLKTIAHFNDESTSPVFFGHYWLNGFSDPSCLTKKACCLDYSAAKGGKMVAYTFKGEKTLRNENFTWIQAGSGPLHG